MQLTKNVTNTVKYIYQKYSSLLPLYRFILHGVLLGLLWALFYKIIRNYFGINDFYLRFTDNLTFIYLYISKLILSVFGFEPYITGKIIFVKGARGIMLDKGCLGRNLMGLFVGFLLAFPGNIKSKIWYIPVGLVVIFMLNIMRIVALTLVNYYMPNTDIPHHEIYNYTVYTAIFFLWYFWIAKLSKFDKSFVKRINK